MSSGAVEASDPGGGEPKLVPGADVEMTEAAEEAVAAPVAGVKLEEKAGEVPEAEGGAVAWPMVSDSLYATESAGMVTEEGREDEPAEGVKVQVGAGGLHGEVDSKPVLAGDVAAPAVAGQMVEAESSATPELTLAEPDRENEERGNALTTYDKDVQNNVPGDVFGSSKIHEGNGAPGFDQLNDKSEMSLQILQDVPGSGTIPNSNEASSSGNVVQCARYCLPPLGNGGFRVSDLVWGKVKSHPWWPGEIFDPSDASDLALKHQKRDSHLVAYFGDNTFAWCDESQLKPFVTNYSQMEKQSSSDAFVGSVNNALEELSRRILSGMSCSCLPEELSDSGMSYTVENAGLKDGVTCSAVNRSEILKCFSPENLLHYIKELALFPGQGGDLLELVIACSQLTSFYRSKGCSELASFQTGDAWVEDGMDTPSAQNVIVQEAVINEVQPTQDKPKRGRGRPRKQKPEYDTSNINDNTYHDTMGREMGMEFDNFGNLDSKKKRNFDTFDDSDRSSTPTVGSSFKIGECIRRAASQLAGSASIVKAQNEPTLHKTSAEAENGEFDVVSDDADDELTVLNRAKMRRMYRNHTADPSELLSQLCVAATEPISGHSFSAMIISFFSDYRNYVVSTATEASIIEKNTSKRGRKRKGLPSPEVETTDHMQDSYWSGLSLHNHPIHNLTNESSTARPRRRRRSSRQTYVPLSELGASPKKQIQVIERSIIHVDEKMVDELKPTALVLSFGRSASVPSEMDLIKMFSRYGPLRETETEVDKDTNTVKVVFKKRSDAERAFSVAGKYGTFGPSLRSYRLVNLPFSLRTSEVKNPERHPEDCGPEVSVQNEPSVPMDAMQIDQVDNTDKTEVLEERAAEQVEIIEQTSQMEAAGAQIESVSEGSPEQFNSVEQACTQKEASVEAVQDITQSETAIGASNGSFISEMQLAETQNQALLDDTESNMQMEAAPEAQVEDTVKQHADGTNDKSIQMISDNTQVDNIAEAPKQGHISEDDAEIEQQVGSEVPKQVSGEVPCSSNLESETLSADPVGLDSVEQVKGESQGEPEVPKQVSGEVPCSPNLEAENVSADPVGLGSVKQVEEESQTVIEVSGEQMFSIEQSVQVRSVTEALGTQIEVERQTPEDNNMVDAAMGGSVVVEEILESQVQVPMDESVDNIAAGPDQVKETTEEKTIEEAIDERIENKAAAEALAGETQEGKAETPYEITEDKTAAEASAGRTKEGETEVEAPEFKTESNAVVEPLAREKTASESTAEVPVEKTRKTDEIVEDAKEAVANASIVIPVEKTTTAEETVEDAEKTRAADEIVEDAKEAVANASIVMPVEKTTTAEETVEDATVETSDGRILEEFEKTTEDAAVETSDGRTLEEVEKTTEDVMVGALDGKSATSEKTLEDTKVDVPGVQAGASEQTV